VQVAECHLAVRVGWQAGLCASGVSGPASSRRWSSAESAAAAIEAWGRPSASAAVQPANSSDSRMMMSADHACARRTTSGSMWRAAAPMNRLAVTQAKRSWPVSAGNASPPAARHSTSM
jgi:hypothetical protein